MSIFNYKRKPTCEVRIGNTAVGGDNPVRLQSMNNTSTMDTEGSVAQAVRIADAGGEIVRLTTQGEREAANMAEIRKGLDARGYDVPLVADVHFNPRAAYVAAATCQKVRINPGNFADAARTFKKLEFTPEEYACEIERIRERLVPFLNICKEHGTAVRLGVNHGSLSDRIMSRYGDTAPGMTESVMEYLHICRDENFHNIVISIKSSNTIVMTETVRMLRNRMETEGMSYPLHLGVTEAGDGEDGRIKSALGIGTLLAEGLGDTIRVSLSEDPEAEIPVAKLLRDYIASREGHPAIEEPAALLAFPARSQFNPVPGHKENYPAVAYKDFDPAEIGVVTVDAASDPSVVTTEAPIILTSNHINAPGEIASWIERFGALGKKNPIIVKLSYCGNDKEEIEVKAAVDFGVLLLHGYGNAIWLDAPGISSGDRESIALGILQAARLRISRTEYISCPSCGRTLFDLQKTLAEVKKATSHLAGLKIGVMGCVVNGPGEMADADYGYVGAGPGRVSLYKGKKLLIKNIPAEEALPKLLEIIENDSNPGLEK